MKTKPNPQNGAVAAAVNVTKNTVFSFKKRPVIAPKGMQNASYGGAINEVGDEVNTVIAEVKLGATDPLGQPMTLTEKYNITPSGRGAKAFLADYNAWTGAGFTEDDLYESFDGAKDIGKPLVVEVGHRKQGKTWEAYIMDWHPAGATEVVAAA